MALLRYAFAGVRYYKKQSIIIGIFFSFFLLALTFLFDLRSSIRLLYDQVEEKLGFYDSAVETNFSRESLYDSISIYSNTIVIILTIFFVLSVLLFFLMFRKRETELANWRLLGFSKFNVWLIMLLEIALPSLIGAFFLFSLVTVFQTIYEASMQTINFSLLTRFSATNFSVRHTLGPASNLLLTIMPENAASLFTIDFSRGFSVFTIFNSIIRSAALLIACSGVSLSIWKVIAIKNMENKLR